MSWDDRYFDAAPRTSRSFFAFAGIVMLLFGVLLALGGRHAHAGDSIVQKPALVISGIGLALYGIDLVVRAIRPRRPGRAFAGVSGRLRLLGAMLFTSLLVGTGVYAMVRGDLLAGAVVAAGGIAGKLALLFARARDASSAGT